MIAASTPGPFRPRLAPGCCLERAGTLDVAVRTGSGRVIPADAAAAGPGFAVVADGVGSRRGSALAAGIGVTAASWRLQAAAHIDEAVARGCVLAAQDAIDDAGWDLLGDGCTTLTLAVITRDETGERRVFVAWCGDSPAAVVHPDGDWEWLTTPDGPPITPAGRPRDLPVLSSGRLDQALGVDRASALNVHVRTLPLPLGATVVLATDGLISADRDCADLLAGPGALSAQHLADAAARFNSPDDVAVVCLRPDGHASDELLADVAPLRRRGLRRLRRKGAHR